MPINYDGYCFPINYEIYDGYIAPWRLPLTILPLRGFTILNPDYIDKYDNPFYLNSKDGFINFHLERSSNMTKEEFGQYTKAMTNKYWVTKRHAQFDTDEEAVEQLKQHDPELAVLMQKNVDNAREYYAYVIWKYGEEDK